MTLLRVTEVAERLNASTSFVYAMIGSGRLRHYRIGKGQGGIRVSEEHLALFLAGREKGGGPEPDAPSPPPVRPPFRHLKL